jgi:DNA-binding transcriptional LysR family regulator
MNLRFVETFVWLAKLRNFRLTAEKLHTTQGAVSSRIAALEEEFGVRLFVRDTRDVTLTLEGNKALGYAETLVRTMHEMRECMTDRKIVAGIVRIGVVESIIHSWFPQFMVTVHEAYPGLEIEITHDTTIHLIDQFSRGNLDLILQTDSVVGAMVQNLPLCDLPLRWVAATKLGLHHDTLRLADLVGFQVLSFSRNSGPHKFIERLFDHHLGRAVRVNCLSSASALVRLVEDGYGVALIPPAIISRELREGTVQVLKLDVEMPGLPLVGSFRSRPENPLYEQIALLAQDTAQAFARSAPDDIARLSIGKAASAWTFGQRPSPEPQPQAQAEPQPQPQPQPHVAPQKAILVRRAHRGRSSRNLIASHSNFSLDAGQQDP